MIEHSFMTMMYCEFCLQRDCMMFDTDREHIVTLSCIKCNKSVKYWRQEKP